MGIEDFSQVHSAILQEETQLFAEEEFSVLLEIAQKELLYLNSIKNTLPKENSVMIPFYEVGFVYV